MSVRQFPEPGAEKQYPFGTNGSFTFDNALSSGVYEVNITGDDSFNASANALTVISPDGWPTPVHLDAGEGVVSVPFDDTATLNAASISTPTIASFSKIKYDQGSPPSGLSVSFDSNFSGSYVVDVTVPGEATEVYAYYENGQRDVLGTTFPASVSSPNFDTSAAFSASVLNLAILYEDDKSLFGKGLSASVTYPTPTGTFATGGDVYVSGGYRYHKFTSNGTLTVLADGDMEYMLVAGGGGGGRRTFSVSGGGGGAGGLLSGSFTSSGNISITVGGGGAADTGSGAGNGSNSVLPVVSASVATGGGRGGSSGINGGSGGSGGGAGGNSNPGSGTAGQGGNGGSRSNTNEAAGGGGGKNAAGGNGSGPTGGAGGSGTDAFSTWATATSSGDGGYFAGGGGAGGLGSSGAGGAGGGGDGGGNGEAGAANTGGGAGGGGQSADGSAKAGGSGIVIIRYPT